MSFITQLHPSIPMETPKGRGEAILVLDYGPEYNLMFTVALDSDGRLWTFQNSQVALCRNETLGRLSGGHGGKPGG